MNADDIIKILRGQKADGNFNYYPNGDDPALITKAALDTAADLIESLQARLVEYDALAAEYGIDGKTMLTLAKSQIRTAQDNIKLREQLAESQRRERAAVESIETALELIEQEDKKHRGKTTNIHFHGGVIYALGYARGVLPDLKKFGRGGYDYIGGQRMNWTSVKDKLPESGERVLVYWYESPDLHQMHVIDYYKAGDIVDDEVIYQGDTPIERLKDAIFGSRGQRTIEQDGFYIYDPDIETGLCKWRRHNDCITHWMPLPAPPKEG